MEIRPVRPDAPTRGKERPMLETTPAVPGEVKVLEDYWLVSSIYYLIHVRVLSIKHSASKEVPDMYTVKILPDGVEIVHPAMELGRNCFMTREEAVPAMLAVIDAKDESLRNKRDAIEAERRQLQEERYKYSPRKDPPNKLM